MDFTDIELSGKTRREHDLLGEMDFVQALDKATGGDWETFLTDWLFNVGDYIDQQIEFYE